MSRAERPLRTAAELADAGLIEAADVPRLDDVAARYPVAITGEMAALIARGRADDPIGRQFIPDLRELEASPGEHADPIGDHVHERVRGLVHRYPDRVLLKVTHVCPVYCRFCFRREMVGPSGPPTLQGEALEAAVTYIARDSRIFEVILTGGDPFMLAPRRLAELTRRLAAIPHVAVLRWHTRVPVVDPGRVTAELVSALRSADKPVFVAIHSNHARELTDAARGAIERMRSAGIGLIAQTVLLKGVNADAPTLEALFRGLLALGVRPYYLHHPDLAPGTAHFRLTIAEGQAIMRALRGRVSGLALPTYVLDIPGGHGKVPIGPAYVAPGPPLVVLDPAAVRHIYRDGPGRS